ncbi:hypothetical protein [Microbulbifer sp. HZ11]|uniref:hypothetical protein n=1 Tax=unclassified Microbulbifer TaxID=2619833 RepID=UPI0005BDB9A1|nr:hypothetical protein [Microbulbifer sp. HZ11]
MSFLRDDIQVALQWLHSWALETLSHFQFVADHEVGVEVVALCGALATEREQLAGKLAAAIRDTGDLPAEPDPDREAVLQVQEQLSGIFAEHGSDAMLAYCRSREEAFLAQVRQEAGILEESEFRSLLSACQSSAELAVDRLQP